MQNCTFYLATFEHTYELHVNRQYRWSHRLGHHVGSHRLSPHIEQFDPPLAHPLSDEVPLRQDVFAATVVDGVLCQRLDRLVVGEQVDALC